MGIRERWDEERARIYTGWFSIRASDQLTRHNKGGIMTSRSPRSIPRANIKPRSIIVLMFPYARAQSFKRLTFYPRFTSRLLTHGRFIEPSIKNRRAPHRHSHIRWNLNILHVKHNRSIFPLNSLRSEKHSREREREKLVISNSTRFFWNARSVKLKTIPFSLSEKKWCR